MLKPKSNPIKMLVKLVKGDFSEMITTLIDENCNIKDDHPLEGILIKFRKRTEDTAKNSITYHGQSKLPKLSIDKLTDEFINDGNGHLKGTIWVGYNELNSHNMIVIDCGPPENNTQPQQGS